MILRTLGTLALVLLMAASAPAAPRASAHLYVRGSKNLTAILQVMKSDLDRRGKTEAPLLVILVDPGGKCVRAIKKLGRSLDWLQGKLPENARVLLIPVDGEWPKLEDEPQDFGAACRRICPP